MSGNSSDTSTPSDREEAPGLEWLAREVLPSPLFASPLQPDRESSRDRRGLVRQ